MQRGGPWLHTLLACACKQVTEKLGNLAAGLLLEATEAGSPPAHMLPALQVANALCGGGGCGELMQALLPLVQALGCHTEASNPFLCQVSFIFTAACLSKLPHPAALRTTAGRGASQVCRALRPRAASPQAALLRRPGGMCGIPSCLGCSSRRWRLGAVRPSSMAAQEGHWALQYEGMEALLAYARSPNTGDFKAVLPKSAYNPGASHAVHPHAMLLRLLVGALAATVRFPRAVPLGTSGHMQAHRMLHADDEDASERFAQLLRQHMRRECPAPEGDVAGLGAASAGGPMQAPAHERCDQLCRLAKRAQALEVQLAEASEACGAADALSAAADAAWQVCASHAIKHTFERCACTRPQCNSPCRAGAAGLGAGAGWAGQGRQQACHGKARRHVHAGQPAPCQHRVTLSQQSPSAKRLFWRSGTQLSSTTARESLPYLLLALSPHAAWWTSCSL